MITHDQHRNRLKYAEVSGGRLAYVDEGQGKAILLVHGIPTSSWLYRHIIPRLVEKGYRVIAPDLLGFGASNKPRGYTIYSEQHQGQRLLDLMAHLGIENWVQVCHDAGGLWTWEMLKKHKTGVTGLVFLNTIIYEEGFDPPMRFEPGRLAKCYTCLYKNRFSAKMMINATLKNGLGKGVKLSKDDKRGYLVPMLEGADKALYYFFTQTCNELPGYYDDLLRALDQPAMVIWGAKDPMLKWEPQAEKVMKDLEMDAKDVHILPDAGHFIQEEYPAEISDWIADFVSR